AESLGGGADRVAILAELLDQLRVECAVLVVVDLERVKDPGERQRMAWPVGSRHVHRIRLDPLEQGRLEVALVAVVHDLTGAEMQARGIPACAVAGRLRLRRGAGSGEL